MPNGAGASAASMHTFGRGGATAARSPPNCIMQLRNRVRLTGKSGNTVRGNFTELLETNILSKGTNTPNPNGQSLGFMPCAPCVVVQAHRAQAALARF